MVSFQATVIIAFVASAVLVIVSNANPDVTFEASACNGREIDLLSDYARARDIVLNYAVKYTPTSKYDYNGEGRYMLATAFGRGKCNSILSKEGCERCMQVAERQVIASCAQNTEGWVQLKDCYIGFWEFPVR